MWFNVQGVCVRKELPQQLSLLHLLTDLTTEVTQRTDDEEYVCVGEVLLCEADTITSMSDEMALCDK